MKYRTNLSEEYDKFYEGFRKVISRVIFPNSNVSEITLLA
jgi:preprotein translocase subunit SecE